MRKIKWKFIGVMLLVVVMILSACSSSGEGGSASQGGDSSEKIKIGFILSDSGTFAPLSENIKNGFKLYLEQNDNKLGGKEVELIFEDDEANPQVALRKYKNLVGSEKVNFLVGPISSSVVYALRDEVEKDKVILIDANAAGNDLSWDLRSDYVIRTSFSNWQNGSSAGSYIANNIGKTAMVIAPDYPAGQEVASAFKESFEAAGGKVVKEVYPKLGTNDFATYLTDVSQTNPDVVYAFFTGSDGIRFVQQYNDFGLKGKIPLTGPMEFGDLLIVEPAGDSAEGIVSGIIYSPWIDNEENKQFVEAYEKTYNKLPNTFSVQGYDSALIIDQAIKEAGSVDTEELVKVLKGISFDSPRGPITIDPKTNNPIQNFYIVENVKKDNEVVPEIIETIENVTMPETNPAK